MFPRLLLLFLIVPLVELYLLIKIGGIIGLPATLAIIVITAFLGASLTRAQGAKVLQRFQQATMEGRLPHEEVMDGLMILLAGAVLLTPGFITDIAGFLLLVPPIRTLVRKLVVRMLKGRIQMVEVGGGSRNASSPPRRDDGVIEAEAEVIDDKR